MSTQYTKITAVIFCWNILSPCLKTGKALCIFETKMKFILFAPQVFLVRDLYLNSLILERHLSMMLEVRHVTQSFFPLQLSS